MENKSKKSQSVIEMLLTMKWWTFLISQVIQERSIYNVLINSFENTT